MKHRILFNDNKRNSEDPCEAAPKNIISDLCDCLSRYSFDQLYCWLAAVAVLPQNQRLVYRFEIILGNLLAIPPEISRNQKLSYSSFCELLIMADCIPFFSLNMMIKGTFGCHLTIMMGFFTD